VNNEREREISLTYQAEAVKIQTIHGKREDSSTRRTLASMPVRPVGFKLAEAKQAQSLFGAQTWKSVFHHWEATG
jgi:hypothetical protein